MEIKLDIKIDGKILDIGGGGEGIIGRLFKNCVTAIDNRQEELDEAPDCFEKRLMDATALDFEDETFDSVTAFYSFMFMDKDTAGKAAKEMERVLKKGGKIYIWDTEIPFAEKEPFCVDLKVFLPEETIDTTYGIMGKNMERTFDETKNMFEELGLVCKKQNYSENNFFLELKKQ